MENKRDQISLGQLAAVVWTAVLAPGTGVVPGAAARTAGAAGWLSTLLALPAILLLGRAVWWLTRDGREDLAQSCCRVLGRTAGSALLLLY